MLYCSIEDAWGPLPVNKQMESYNKSKNKGLEHFQNSIRKKVNKTNKKKKLRRKIIKETFDDEESENDVCYEEDSEPEMSEVNKKYQDEEERYQDEEDMYQDDEEMYQDEESIDEEDLYESEENDSKINNLRKKINKLIKENKSLKSKVKKLQRNSPLLSSDLFQNIITDKNREIIIMSLIGLMIIIVFHLLLRSTR